MKFINESATKFLSVKLPVLGALLMLIALVLQWALDYQFIPAEYQTAIATVILPALSWLGRKIAQPKLHGDANEQKTN